MRNSKDWTKEIEEVYDGVKAKRTAESTAIVLLSAVSQIISLTRLELEHARLMGQHGKTPEPIILLAGGSETKAATVVKSRRVELLRRAAELESEIEKEEAASQQ